MSHAFLHVMYIILCGIQFLVAIGLITLVTMQDAKNDGLTGQIGTTAATSFKGKSGREEQLGLMTRNVAIVFMVISVIVAFATKRWN